MNKIVLENKLNNKTKEVKKLTDKIVDNQLKLRDSIYSSILSIILSIGSVSPGFLIALLLPKLYLLSIPYFIVGSYIMSYSITEVLDTIILSLNINKENKYLRNKAIVLRGEIDSIVNILSLNNKEELSLNKEEYIEPWIPSYERENVRKLKK